MTCLSRVNANQHSCLAMLPCYVGIGAQTTHLLAEFTCQWQYDKRGQPEQDGQDVQKPEKEPTPEAPN